MREQAVLVRDFDHAPDAAWAEAVLTAAFGGRWQARRGELNDVLRLRGLVAEGAGEPIGQLLFNPHELELVRLPDQGIPDAIREPR